MTSTDNQATKPAGGAAKAPELVVYRASAGSGKTFTLAVEYIALLMKNPEAYRNILAVTFTNKATAEMKERILSQLYGIGKGLRGSDDYLRKIMDDLKLDINSSTEVEKVRESAGEALQLILHDYTNFNVATIDSFFQRILRNIAKELKLNANLRVELNNEEVESLAVDRLLSELKTNDKVFGWIMGYIGQQMSDKENWKVVDNIRQFGKKIFSHEYEEHAEAIEEKVEEKDFFDDYIKALRKVKEDADKEMKAEADGFYALLRERGYAPDDFSSVSGGPLSYFKKLRDGKYIDGSNNTIPGKKTIKAMDASGDDCPWVYANDKDKDKADFAKRELTRLLIDAESKRKVCSKRYTAADLILKHINELRLLSTIAHVVKEMTKETNTFLLSDTQPLLDKLMKGSDAPFVFEKAGSLIRHIMIDEFQDTSVVQWGNFKKLLLECMAHPGSRNMIVGDVKQSIYRWRNSDWSLLNDIQQDKDLAGKNVSTVSLGTNFRSERNIVDFNNEFFTIAATVEQDFLETDGNGKASLLPQIYSTELTHQAVPEGRGTNGLVDIRLLPAQNVEDFNSQCIEFTKEYIETLIANGAEQNDIAILIRYNKNISPLATELQKDLPDLDFVSDEAFRLDASVAVNIIVNAMKSLCPKADPVARAQLAMDYHKYILNDTAMQVRLPYTKNTDEYIESIRHFLPSEFTEREDHLRSLPLNELAEELCRIFEVVKLDKEPAYIYAFFDQLSAFTRTNTPDLNTLSEYWDSTMHKKTVKGGDIKGIRLLTIHKAKGLEFDHVIVPFCDWKLYRDDTLWCTTEEKPFGDMPVLTVDSTRLKDTIFNDEYHEEKLQTTVDNLNLLYVAFTRAAKNLFVIGMNSTKMKKDRKGIVSYNGIGSDRRSGLLQKVLPVMASELSGAEFTGNPQSNEGELHFTYGTLYIKNSQKKQSDNIFLPKKPNLFVPMKLFHYKQAFRQSNSSRAFVAESEEEQGKRDYLTQGTILHNVLANIRSTDDVDRVLEAFAQEGVLSASDERLDRKRLSSILRQRIVDNHHALVKEWFAPGVQVLNECSILCTDPETGQVRTLRPDRVVRQGDKTTVVDFKFARPQGAHFKQVRGYMDLLRNICHNDVRGYLWYVYDNKIEEVK